MSMKWKDILVSYMLSASYSNLKSTLILVHNLGMAHTSSDSSGLKFIWDFPSSNWLNRMSSPVQRSGSMYPGHQRLLT